MCMCARVCMCENACGYMCARACVCACVFLYVPTSIHVYAFVCMSVCMILCLPLYESELSTVHVCMCMYACVYVYLRMWLGVYISHVYLGYWSQIFTNSPNRLVRRQYTNIIRRTGSTLTRQWMVFSFVSTVDAIESQFIIRECKQSSRNLLPIFSTQKHTN